MKNLFHNKTIFTLLTALILCLTILSCQRDDAAEDDIPQEELTNIVLNVKNLSTQEITSYNYSVGAGSAPVVKLVNGVSYEVRTTFLNGSEDVTQEIKDAKDEHFLIFDFPRSQVNLTRLDTAESTGTNGKVGLITKWEVIKVVNSPSPLLKVTLIHEPATASESQNGTAWGSVTGGETDAEATFQLSN
ncbi:hypothetical protein [Chryseobacterium sp. MP_3.2]|uniref:hypothetical protein n=1 Tax=Chryseobacterium sp. MP_3.2 TaxID=3071712 RepID=UPI002E0C4C0A|nr:hypothetical protein [Chryseobacterium sp. MP_3.2]